jgi:threonylcarbamoyladenosine tRNA methylthiotransferase MtaB
MRVYLTAVGCKLNQAEIAGWARQLTAMGYEIVDTPAEAELCIVNTCAVTHVAARKSRNMVRRCARAQPHSQTIVAGCYAQVSPAEAASLEGGGLVICCTDKDALVQTAIARLGLQPLKPLRPARPSRFHRTRALVKIQDGCDNACTYCIVRVARGRQRSLPVASILEEVAARESEGYQEIVLTGVHIGAYGRERGESLAELVGEILSCSHLPRLRLSSIEPWDLSTELVGLWKDSRLCRHMHLPLQSGCDTTLVRMGRRYTTSLYRDWVSRARSAIADLAITTDVIVGFPGEDEREFGASLEFVASLGLARVHVFPFSLRPGTPAALMPGQVPARIKEERAARMRAVADSSAVAFRQRFLGRSMPVLWESASGNQWSGLTDNYIRVQITSELCLGNSIRAARLLESQGLVVRAELEE